MNHAIIYSFFLCDKTYSWSLGLKGSKHIVLTHHKERNYSCLPETNKIFRSLSYYKVGRPPKCRMANCR